jgi:hypothetical protein
VASYVVVVQLAVKDINVFIVVMELSGNAAVVSLYTVAELQNILSCCLQKKKIILWVYVYVFALMIEFANRMCYVP